MTLRKTVATIANSTNAAPRSFLFFDFLLIATPPPTP
jgi:hypothetical protein